MLELRLSPAIRNLGAGLVCHLLAAKLSRASYIIKVPVKDITASEVRSAVSQ